MIFPIIIGMAIVVVFILIFRQTSNDLLSIAIAYQKFGNLHKPFTFPVINKGNYEIYSLTEDEKIILLAKLDES
ncbi:MAG: hypothetical protein ACRYGG_20265, partial [Janthinobacterium lividum]